VVFSTGCLAELYQGQYIAVAEPGVESSVNLLKAFGDAERAMKATSGWWLARVSKVINPGGAEETPPAFDRAAIAAMDGKRQKATKKHGVDATDPQGVPRVTRLVVDWYGQRDASGSLSCHADRPMVSLGIRDRLPRDTLLYEEWNPGHIGFKGNMCLTRAGRKKIDDVIPRPLVTAQEEQGHDQQVTGMPAPPRSSHNHAGILIRPNEGPRGPEEQELWQAALAEVAGHEWRGARTAEEINPPGYRVANIRRERGTMYAVVSTDQHDVQYDHRLTDIRKRMFQQRVASMVSRVPFVLLWSNLKESKLTIDFRGVLECAESYDTVARFVILLALRRMR
jgi:hypothetical protein